MWRRPLQAAAAWLVVALALMMAILPSPGRAADTTPPIPADVAAALLNLKTADAAGRQKIYDLIGKEGDVRLIPVLKAYKTGSLLLQNGKLAMYGARIQTPDGASMLPLLDALTGRAILGDDGKPILKARPDLSKALRSPPRSEWGTIADLTASLSLLDPDPVARTASIRDAAEHAARAVPDEADADRLIEKLAACSAALKPKLAASKDPAQTAAIQSAITAINVASAEKPASVMSPAPSDSSATAAKSSLRAVQPFLKPDADADAVTAVTIALSTLSSYEDHLEARKKVLDDLPKTLAALQRQLDKEPNSSFAPALKEAIASIKLVTGDAHDRVSAAQSLGKIATGRAANLLAKIVDASARAGDAELHAAAASALSSAQSYQDEVHFIQNTFAGLSLGSILVLLALGLSIIFGLMGVINMAQGEFMMVGAFTTYVVSEGFKRWAPGSYDYFLIAAIPASFLIAGLTGLLAEALVIRRLYGRPLETLLATWGIGLVLIWAVRWKFGDNVSVKPPAWMEGGWEIAPDLVFPLNRVYIVLFCVLCIAVVYYVVNGTKLGLLLRATTQNREMASALGVPTRWVDGLTFAFGTGLAGLAGVVVPLYNKINPNVGQEYIVDCFMVVVVGGVGKLAGAIWAGLGLGFVGKYLESILGNIPMLASGSSVIGKVLVLASIIVFLQWRPQGLFPPKGRNTDA